MYTRVSDVVELETAVMHARVQKLMQHILYIVSHTSGLRGYGVW